LGNWVIEIAKIATTAKSAKNLNLLGLTSLVPRQTVHDFFCNRVSPFGNLLGGLVLNWMRYVNRIEAGTAKGAGLSAGGRNELSRGDGDSRNAKVL